MAQFKKIGVLTSGGDAPGMNASIRAIARYAADKGIETVGIIGGYRGLIDNEMIPLTPDKTANIIGLSGTTLYTDRCLDFKTPEGMAKAIKTCKDNEIDAIIAIGGDGTFRGATDLTLHGIPAIGVTGTIDNDITATDYTVGFDTAQNTCLEVIDRLRDTCESHARCNVVEIMGRDCGELTLKVGIASGAVAIAIPEMPFDEAAAIENIKKLKAQGQRGMIVAVSEGVFTPDGKKYGEYLAKKIEEETEIETKFARLAHIQRGGNPTMRDRYTATLMGVRAIDLLLEGKSNMIVCVIDGEISTLEIRWALAADRMYKKKLKDGDLDGFTAEQVDAMKALCEKRHAEVEYLYNLNLELAKAKEN